MNFLEKILNGKKLNKEEKAVFNIYTELYEKATPSANFTELLKNAEIIDEQYDIKYENYKIHREIADEIINKHSKNWTKWKKQQLKVSIYLGASPCFFY